MWRFILNQINSENGRNTLADFGYIQKQSSRDVLRNTCLEKFCKVLNVALVKLYIYD